MNEQPSPQAHGKRWKWLLGSIAVVLFSTALAVPAILSIIDFNKLKPIITQAIKKETGRDLEIRGRIEFKLGFRPSLVMDDVFFQNAPWASRPDMVKIKRLEAKIMLMPLLKRDIQIARLVLVEPEVLLETDESGKWNFEFEKTEASRQIAAHTRRFILPRMAFRQVEVEKGKVSYREGGTGRLYSLAIDRFTARSERFESPVVLAFNGSYKEKPLELRGTIGSFLLLREQGQAYPVDLVLKVLSAQLKVEGRILDMQNLKGLALKVSAQVQSISQMAAFLGETRTPEFGPLQTTFAISDAGDKTYTLSDLRISSRAGDAVGSLTVHLGGSRPTLSGALSSQTLNLNTFFNGGKKRQVNTERRARKDRLFPNDPLPLNIFKSADVHLKFDADRVQLSYLPLTNLSMEVSVDNGRLIVRPIKIKVAGGDAEGQLQMQPQGSVATAKAVFKASQTDLRLLAPDLGVEGKVDVELDLLSRGSSVAGLMAALNGGMVVVMGHGRVDNRNIQYLAGDLAGGIFQLLNPSSKTANHTDINCGVSGFDIQDGMAKVTALVVDTLDMTVIGEGEVSLRDETLDLSLKPYPKGGAAGLNLSLTELTKSLKLGGTLANPSLEMNAEQTIFAVLKAAGGVLLFGPAGIVAALAGQSSCEDNPCLSALETARKGMRRTESGKGREQKGTDDKEGISGTLKGVCENVKKFFSGQGTQPRVDTAADPNRGGGP
jgi:uncharacterized protein involved in outer membrane biogenesis